MSIQDLHIEKINLINWITRLQDESVIEKLKKLRSKEDIQDFVLSDKHLEILNQRREDHLSGKSKSHTWEEVKAHARGSKKR